MININKIIQITLLVVTFMVSLTVNAFSKETTYDDVAALEKAVEEAKKTLDEVNNEYNILTKGYDEQIKKLQEEKDAAYKRAEETYDKDIADLEAKVNACKENCADLLETLSRAKGIKKAALEAADSTYNNNKKKLDDGYKPNLKHVENKQKDAQKAYDKAVKEYNKAKQNIIDDAEDDLKDAEKDYEKAKKDIEKYCGGNKDNDAKCQKAKDKLTQAEKDKKAAQDRVDEYYDTYPDQKPSGGGDSGGDGGDGTEGDSGEDGDGGSDTPKEPERDMEQIKAEYDKLNSAAETANDKYQEAKQAYADKEKEYYNKAFECVQKGKTPEQCQSELDGLKSELENLKADADAAYAEKLKADSELNAFLAENPDMNLGGKKNAYESLDSKVNSLQAQYDQAVANCEFAKTFTTYAGQAAAEEYCALADSLKQQLEQATAERDAAKEAYADALKELGPEAQGYYFMAGEGQVYDVYEANDDVFKTTTRRAARILMGIRPLVYLFGAFGLVGFAFAAIFNKISWKWFANISIGLFLVANMGRLIEYMVFPNSDADPLAGHIDSVIEAKPLSAFEDTIKEDIKISQILGDADYEYVEPVSSYDPTPPKAEVLPNITEPQDPVVEGNEEFGFCAKGGGFMKCVQDILGFISNVTDTINTIKNTASRMGVAGDAIQTNINNILSAIKKMTSNPLKALDALSEINNGIQSSIGTIMDSINTIDNNAGHIGDTWEGDDNPNNEGGEQKGISKEDLQNAVNSLNSVGKGVDAALSVLKGFGGAVGGVLGLF